jgi:2-keto-4-pentenoate hydratase/2-oxohepta-3-ene-1,7-dioic acid hydratase in catechol pathway
MRLYTFETKRQHKVGAERDGKLVELPFASMIDLIRAGSRGLSAAKKALKSKRAEAPSHELKKVKLLAPIPRPGKILCSGLNYRSHVEEEPGAKFLEDPRFFSKLPSVVVGPNAPILHPGLKFQVDYEVELAVVFGKNARRVKQKDALDVIFGYTILHDVSARWIQFKDANETMGKNFDSFSPMGPCIVTAEEIPHPEQLCLSLKLNGKTMIARCNDDWCFSLPKMIEWLTMAMTIEPGDVMTTGCPAGVGYFQNPQVFLKPGDVCELEIQPIGKLINPVVKDW